MSLMTWAVGGKWPSVRHAVKPNTRALGASLTQRVSACRVLRTLGGIRDTVETLLEARVLRESAWVIGVCLVHGTTVGAAAA